MSDLCQIENLAVFTALATAALLSGAANKNIIIGANVFFWARVAYWPTYLAGIPGLRTVIWGARRAGRRSGESVRRWTPRLGARLPARRRLEGLDAL